MYSVVVSRVEGLHTVFGICFLQFITYFIILICKYFVLSESPTKEILGVKMNVRRRPCEFILGSFVFSNKKVHNRRCNEILL